jgi:hypothetical protein
MKQVDLSEGSEELVIDPVAAELNSSVAVRGEASGDDHPTTPASMARSLVENGYRPLPLQHGEKRPTIARWPDFAARVATIESDFLVEGHQNIGLILGETIAIDIDVLEPEVAQNIQDEALQRFPNALLRIGECPKCALILRCDYPIKKMATLIHTINGLKCQVEVLGKGQQIVAFGLHPKTRQNYRWVGPSPIDVRQADLPRVFEQDVSDFLTWCGERLQEAAASVDLDQTLSHLNSNVKAVQKSRTEGTKNLRADLLKVRAARRDHESSIHSESAQELE